MAPMIDISSAAKTFTMHLQNGVRLPVVSGVTMQVNPRRMRRAGRAVRRGQVIDFEDDLR